MAIGAAQASGGSRVEKRQQYETLRASLMTERATFDAHYRELADFIFPRRTRFWTADRNKGDKRSQNIIDSTGRFAARTLQSGIHAGLTSPARPWMRLTTPDPGLAESSQVKQWLHIVTQRMLTVFLRSNLYNTLPTLYGDIGVFATGAMGLLEDSQDLLRSYSYPIGSFCLGLDSRGMPSTFVRDWVLTVRQLVTQFGRVERSRDIDWSRLSTNVKSLWDAGDYEQPVEVSWIVTPNDEYDPGKLEASRSMPWHSCWFERGREEGGAFLRESGFRQFPVVVPRWDVAGEDTYGTDSPGMIALGDIKQLQHMQKRKAMAVDKAVNPPLVGPASLRTQKTSQLAGDITYADVRDGMQGLRPIHEIRLEGIREVAADIGQIQYRIERAFFADLFQSMATLDRQKGNQPITAREIDERHEEKLLALGPVIERMNDELLDPLVDRTFALMAEVGAIPAPPEELRGVDLKVEYVSLMSQAQKLVGVVGQDRFLQSVAVLSDRFPNARHKVNVFVAVDEYADALGVNPKMVIDNEQATAAVQAEQQAIQQQQQAEQLQKVGAGARSLAAAPMGGDTALQALVDGIQSNAA